LQIKQHLEKIENTNKIIRLVQRPFIC